MWFDISTLAVTLSKLFIPGLIVVSLCAWPAAAAITIANKGTANPTLLYQGRPMFKVGPLPESPVFAVKWGSTTFDHERWLNWMAANRLKYGRVYPESGYQWMPRGVDGRVYPFKVVRWRQGRPIVDLARFNPEYWQNVARVVEECAKRGIVLQLQLYQRVYFQGRSGWNANYFNPANNVNKFPVPEKVGRLKKTATNFFDALIGRQAPARNGYGLIQAMAEDTVWRDIHRLWVRHILNAIGDNGNVIIDLMNEGAFNKGMTKDWIESTLDIIDQWERDTGNDLRVGMDFDHLYKAFLKTGDAEPLEYVLSNPRLDVIICEGSESHVVPTLVAGERREPLHKDLALEFRQRYRKPVISTNSPSRGPQDDQEALQLYQWYSLMTKVQGVGVYAKRYETLDLTSPALREYAARARILMRFFDSLNEYAALAPDSDMIVSGPGQYRLALGSSKEVALYLYTGTRRDKTRKRARLELQSLALPDGEVSIVALDPHDGHSLHWQGRVQAGALATELPTFDKDLALHIVPLRQGWADQ
jgi:hypothetical protein